jgi:hypothetical protein
MTAKSRAALATEYAADFADNTTGAITPAILRAFMQDMIDSCLNVTDDYAGLPWTPTITTDATPGTPTYTGVQQGSYERIERLVIARFAVQLSAWSGPSGNLQIAGLPFAAANVANDYGICDISNFILATAFAKVGGIVVPNTSKIAINAVAAAGATSTASVTATQAGATLFLIGRCVYHI